MLPADAVSRATVKVHSSWVRRSQQSSTGRESLSFGLLTSTSSPTSETRTVVQLSGMNQPACVGSTYT